MIEVGEYVRAKDGYIFKIVDIDNIFIYVDKEVRYIEETNTSIDYIKKSSVVKHRKDIIDLLEVGDMLVMLDTKFNTKDYIFIDDIEMLQAVRVDLKDRCKLISILTHEQYQANCYTVERKEEWKTSK